MFFVYVILLKDKETLENSWIDTRSNIVATYRNLTLLNLFLISISYCFKVAIDFSSIFNIENTIIEYAF